MTLQKLITQIRSLVLSHQQIQSFKRGFVSDFFTEKKAIYPAACLQDTGGTISTSAKVGTINFRLFLLDLVHVANDTKGNELDVQSDMFSVAMDIIAWLSSGILEDVRVSTDNRIQLLSEEDNDLPGGVVIDFSVSFPFTQNICQIPID